MSAASSAISSQALPNNRPLIIRSARPARTVSVEKGSRDARRAPFSSAAACRPHALGLEPVAAVTEPQRSRTAFVSDHRTSVASTPSACRPPNMRSARSVSPANTDFAELENVEASAVAHARQNRIGADLAGLRNQLELLELLVCREQVSLGPLRQCLDAFGRHVQTQPARSATQPRSRAGRSRRARPGPTPPASQPLSPNLSSERPAPGVGSGSERPYPDHRSRASRPEPRHRPRPACPWASGSPRGAASRTATYSQRTHGHRPSRSPAPGNERRAP